MPVILALLVVQIIYASGVIVGKFMLPVVPAPVIVTMRTARAWTSWPSPAFCWAASRVGR